MKRIFAGFVVVLFLKSPVTAAMFIIDNPAAKIQNPADKMYNPATQANNPASNMYNPASRMDNPNPLSPPTPVASQPTAAEVTASTKPEMQSKELSQPKPTIPQKNYYLKTAREYITAAKKAFTQDDYGKFLSITEDALRRINAGTLKATKKAKQRLVNYKVFGYGLLEGNKDSKN